MAEDQNVVAAEEEVEAPVAEPAPPAEKPEKKENAEEPWLLGQSRSMWFLIDSAVVLLIVIIMRLTA